MISEAARGIDLLRPKTIETLQLIQKRITSLRNNLIPFCERQPPNPKAQKDLARLRRELDGVSQQESSLRSFEEFVRCEMPREKIIDIAVDMASLGPDNPEHCHCDEFAMEEDSVLRWKHDNHALYNKAIYEIISAHTGLVEQLRAVFQSDIEGPTTNPNEEEPFGKLVVKSFSRDMLEHFLKEQPDPSWVTVPKRVKRYEEE